jgi:signal transduction histidine kinase/CheY-like chemotaxis protein
VEALIAIQSVGMAICSLFAARVLARGQTAPSDIGARATIVALTGQALVWPLYAIASVRALQGGAPAQILSRPLHILLAHNSYIDLALLVLLALGQILVLMECVRQQKERAQEEKARLETEIEGMQKLRTMGWLVAGVAHDLNNPLTAILGFAQELEADARTPWVAHASRVIREGAELCRGIVRSLASLGGERPPRRSQIDAGELVRRVARCVEYQAGRANVQIKVTQDDEVLAFEGEPTGLEQALVYLASNAVQASPSGGKVRIAVRPDGDTLEFAVEDDGPGIPPDLRRRVFEPFFTTKRPGQGTGLGLALARAIVQGHGGGITIEDRSDGRQGARLVVRLPVGGRPVIPLSALAPATPTGLSVFVVDDDGGIRTLLERLGERRGWQVECAEDGRAALAVLRARGELFDAVLCDLHLPGLDGVELHDRLVLDSPALLERFVFITGEQALVERSGFGARARGPIFSKPFDLDVIATTLERRAREAVLAG